MASPLASQLSLRQALFACALFVIMIAVLYLLICTLLPPEINGRTGRFGDGLAPRLPSKSFETISKTWTGLEHLIIVPGHSIQWCTEQGRDLNDEQCWFLHDYQRGQVPLFLEHIKQAVSIAKNDLKSLLLFAGGQTRPGMGPRSEGQSYFSAAEKLGLLTGTLYDRAATEEFSRDSLENLLFSMCRFRQITGKLPSKVTVVGFPFKARRFNELHRGAAQIDSKNFTYVSVQLSGYNQENIIDDAFDDFQSDLFGCDSKLAGKRIIRNPYHQQNGYSESCPELRPLLTKCHQ